MTEVHVTYPLGSGILRLRGAGGGGGDGTGYDPTCVSSRLVIDSFNRANLTQAMPSRFAAWNIPTNSAGTQVGTNGYWSFDNSARTSYPLVFPGTSLGGGKHKISPDFLSQQAAGGTGDPIRVVFTQVPNVAGTMYTTNSTFNGITNLQPGVEYELPNGASAEPTNFVRYDASDGLYHPEMTGAGYVMPHVVAFGAAGDYTAISGNAGVLSIANRGTWGVQLLRNLSQASKPQYASYVNRDYVTVRFKFKVNRLASYESYVSLRVGRVQLDVAPATTYVPGRRGLIRLVTSADSVEESRTDILADTYYYAEIDLRLPEQVVRARVYEASSTPGEDWIQASTGGERVSDTDYIPNIKVWLYSDDSIPWTLTVDEIDAGIADVGSDSLVGGTDPGAYFSGISTSSGDPYGGWKRWPFSDPMDGRAYPVAWPTLEVARGHVSAPSIGASVVWGQFGPDYGPGVDLGYTNYVASYALPATEPAVFGGGPFNPDAWEIYIEGEVGVVVNGTPFAGGSGIINVTVAVKVIRAGTAAISWYDYAAVGYAFAYASFSVRYQQPMQWKPFAGKLDPDVTNGGDSPGSFQYGLEVVGGGLDAIRAAGPLTAGFMLPNGGGFSVNVRDVNIYMRRYGGSAPFPCVPPESGTVAQVIR